MSSHILARLVKPMSWDALSRPCRDMPCRANVEACQAHVVACMPCQAHAFMMHSSITTYQKHCQAPMGCFFKRLLGANHPSGGFLTDGMSSPCQGMSSPCCSMPFAHIVACLAISWDALSRPCRDMPCQAYVGACRARVEACRAQVVPWHGLSSLIHFLLCIFQGMS